MYIWYKTLAILLSTYQRLLKLMNIDEVLTQIVYAVFF